jgi:LPXTG-site transpeptidase (sortase) family protein
VDPASGAGAAAYPSRRRFIVGAAGAAVVVGAGGTAWALTREGTAPMPRSAPARTTARPKRVSVTQETLPPLPIPDPPPDPNAPTPVVVLGRIAIPRLGLDADLGEGITNAAIDRGPSHWPNTALPGQLGNVVVAGHRVSHTEPFRHLERLQTDDAVSFTTPQGQFTYATRGLVIVPANAIDIAAQSRVHTATLFACHPPGDAIERIVVKLRLLGPDGRPIDPDAALPPVDAGAQADGHVLTVRAPDPLGSSGP